MTDLTPSITDATARLVTTVERLRDDDWPAPTECRGWSRAHVIAHVALNAEGLAGAVRGCLDQRPTLMYASDTVRDADIETLAAQRPDTIRERLVTSAAALAEVLVDLPALPAEATFERTPGGRQVIAHGVPLMRLREVEIHHADLRAGYTHADWPQETALRFLEHDAGRHDGPPLTAYASDVDRRVSFGTPTDDDPVVSGPASALAWWATGRDPGDLLTSSTGTVPTMEGR